MAKPLDILTAAFASQQHALVALGTHAIRWMGGGGLGSDDNGLELLIRDSSGPAIVSTLLSSSAWRLSDDLSDLHYLPPADISAISRLRTINDEWLLTLWPESVFGLRIDGPLIQVPDISPFNPILVETEMDPGRGVGLINEDHPWPVFWTKSDLPGALLVEASLPEGVELFVPSVASLLEALCGQALRQPEAYHGHRGPRRYIGALIGALFLEKEGQRRKLEERLEKNAKWDYLSNQLDIYVRVINFRTGELTRGGKPWKWRQEERERSAGGGE